MLLLNDINDVIQRGALNSIKHILLRNLWKYNDIEVEIWENLQNQDNEGN